MEPCCYFCGSSKFRASRFRSTDLPQALLLQFPVRCRRCGRRTYAPLSEFLKLRSARKSRQREERGAN